jgi:peptidoglycan/xylan/chitin deacetylase (PgdA/CDA1 family)
MQQYLLALALLPALAGRAQSTDGWNHKQCAVVLTYDDAIDQDLDNVMPALDSVGLKATFYLIGRSPVIGKRMEEWRTAARNGHELGNHSLTHPCDGTLPGFSSWVDPDRDLSKYTIPRAQDEIRVTNVLLQAIDGKAIRTYAFPCGEFTIHDSSYYLGLRKEFAGARGVLPHMETLGKINPDNIGGYSMDGQTGEQMIALVKQARETHTLLVFVFHGVGGGHSINVNLAAHSQLLHYLKDHSDEIWVAPMVDVATFIRAHQGQTAFR